MACCFLKAANSANDWTQEEDHRSVSFSCSGHFPIFPLLRNRDSQLNFGFVDNDRGQKFWKPSQHQCFYSASTLPDRCVNSVSHAWIWFNLFRSLFWYLMSAFPWVKLRTTTGPWRTPPVCSRGELKCRGRSLYPRWNLKKARSLKWWSLTHGSQQWQTKERG